MAVNPRICFLADATSPHTQKWVEGCLELNWEITVISHWPGTIPGARVIVHPLTLKGFWKYAPEVRRLIREINPAIVHAHQFGAHALYGWFAGCGKLVISAWGSDLLVRPKESKLFRFLVQFLIRRAALITAVSDQVESALIHLGAAPEKILIFPMGVWRAEYESLVKSTMPDHPVICSPRLHEPLYNQRVVLEAFRRVITEYPQVELWFLGDGSQTRELQNLAEKYHLEGVQFWGRLPHPQFLEQLASSTVVVSIPSSDAAPVTLMETFAAGKLPVVSDLPVYRDWITDGVTGLICPIDPDSLAAAIRRALSDLDLQRTAAQFNRRLIATAGIWEDRFQIMLERYKTLVISN